MIAQESIDAHKNKSTLTFFNQLTNTINNNKFPTMKG